MPVPAALRQFVLTTATQSGYSGAMSAGEETAEVNIHLRARAQDRTLIDHAAGLTGANRSQFMLAAAIKEAKHVLLDQTSFLVDNRTFQKVLDRLDAPASHEELAGMNRLLEVKVPWADGR
jgi:uncharacterized protein (DUF1778 family)